MGFQSSSNFPPLSIPSWVGARGVAIPGGFITGLLATPAVSYHLILCPKLSPYFNSK